MGREYAEELRAIPDTITWANVVDLSLWERITSRLAKTSLIVVASGGSISAAHLLAQLHTWRTGQVATVMTPLELAADDHPLDAAVWLLSAGGSNRDILDAWRIAQRRSTRELLVWCGSPNSPLAELARSAKLSGLLTFSVPAGRDGFLATNSLVAFYCLMLRLFGVPVPAQSPEVDASTIAALLERETLIVLYAGWMRPVAIDLESRFVEAALGGVQVRDLRNFAHGRHHWLAKRSHASAVLTISTPRFQQLARDTLAQLPSGIARATWEMESDGPETVLGALLQSLQLAQWAGERLNYDPGRPGVPEFGHRIYELATAPSPPPVRDSRQLAAERKARARGLTPDRLDRCLIRSSEFLEKLSRASVRAVVLDYDGTVVETARRFDDIPASMTAQLNRLLAEGHLLGFATGRGKSIHEKLRNAIDEEQWGRCSIGYYNGGVIRSLLDGCDSLCSEAPPPDLIRAKDALAAALQAEECEFDLRTQQLTVSSKALSELALWSLTQQALNGAGLEDLRIVRSSHSIDVIPRHVSKCRVVDHVAQLAGVDETCVVKIGDRGAWPGNDSELLAMSHGLSVDEVSADESSCWNLAPADLRGPEITQFYLKRIRYQHMALLEAAADGR